MVPEYPIGTLSIPTQFQLISCARFWVMSFPILNFRCKNMLSCGAEWNLECIFIRDGDSCSARGLSKKLKRMRFDAAENKVDHRGSKIEKPQQNWTDDSVNYELRLLLLLQNSCYQPMLSVKWMSSKEIGEMLIVLFCTFLRTLVYAWYRRVKIGLYG